MQAEVAKTEPQLKLPKAQELLKKHESRSQLPATQSTAATNSAVQKLTEAVDLLHVQARRQDLQALADHLAELGYRATDQATPGLKLDKAQQLLKAAKTR